MLRIAKITTTTHIFPILQLYFSWHEYALRYMWMHFLAFLNNSNGFIRMFAVLTSGTSLPSHVAKILTSHMTSNFCKNLRASGWDNFLMMSKVFHYFSTLLFFSPLVPYPATTYPHTAHVHITTTTHTLPTITPPLSTPPSTVTRILCILVMPSSRI